MHRGRSPIATGKLTSADVSFPAEDPHGPSHTTHSTRGKLHEEPILDLHRLALRRSELPGADDRHRPVVPDALAKITASPGNDSGPTVVPDTTPASTDLRGRGMDTGSYISEDGAGRTLPATRCRSHPAAPQWLAIGQGSECNVIRRRC